MNKQEIEKAIEVLRDFERCVKVKADGAYETTDFINAKETAISALTQQLNNGWIPVSERWPIKSGRYLTIYHEWSDGNYLPKYDETYVKILRYREAIFRLPVCIDKKAEQDTHREVLAWMPLPELPEPYREDGESHD